MTGRDSLPGAEDQETNMGQQEQKLEAARQGMRREAPQTEGKLMA